MSLYYQPSNRMPVGGVLLFLLLGTVAAAVLAFAYVYAVWYIPSVYLNFFLCLGFGFALGFVLSGLARSGKLRSPALTGGLALAVGLVALYFEWALYLTLLANATGTGTDTSTSFSADIFFGLLGHPAAMFSFMAEIAKTGTWSVKGTTPSGLVLELIWLAEALIVLGLTYVLARSQATEPFSETANRWAEEEELAHPVLFAHDAAATRAALEAGNFAALQPHQPAGDVDQFARLKLHRVADDHTCTYLTLQNVTKKLDNRGKHTQSSTDVCKHLALSAAAYEELKQRFGIAPAA